MSDELDDIVDHLREPGSWIRIVFMVGFALVLYLIITPLVLVLMIVQALFAVSTGESNYNLRRFGKALSEYVRQILHFITYNSHEKPFPFADFPELEEGRFSSEQGHDGVQVNSQVDSQEETQNSSQSSAAGKETTDSESDAKPAKKTAKKTAAQPGAAKKSTARKSSAKKDSAKKDSTKKGSAKATKSTTRKRARNTAAKPSAGKVDSGAQSSEDESAKDLD